ncbi:hypothetical protein M409DRAFT_50432 [Zasmidium cellare ATCC 36951]|uniref:Uncharacterized protein n=1 Tax=Zasmidium cellare ATCC 36951 TaxID=1080233 RepID=A0A6A6CZY9_ZASCE|nr:uncharacterized protein M409DRAFT_50432 [Zasmidium cellare ATCC 36951]KAF2171790.1 hypothetical protein M409DRAFT_50432 [Zasmidium cellare ATCC 36951]
MPPFQAYIVTRRDLIHHTDEEGRYHIIGVFATRKAAIKRAKQHVREELERVGGTSERFDARTEYACAIRPRRIEEFQLNVEVEAFLFEDGADRSTTTMRMRMKMRLISMKRMKSTKREVSSSSPIQAKMVQRSTTVRFNGESRNACGVTLRTTNRMRRRWMRKRKKSKSSSEQSRMVLTVEDQAT